MNWALSALSFKTVKTRKDNLIIIILLVLPVSTFIYHNARLLAYISQ